MVQAGEYPCGPTVANYLWACNENFQFHYSVAYSAPVRSQTIYSIMTK